VEAFHVEACPVEAFPAEACPVEACPAGTCPGEACPAEACLAGGNKGSFPVEAAYAFQGKAVAASVRADSIECRQVVVAVASCRAWVDPGVEVSVRGAGSWNFAVAVASVAAALISGARDKVAFED
jgi:hypothetical protein